MAGPADPKKITRRRFLRLGIGGAVVLGAGGVLAWQTTGYSVADDVQRRLQALSPKEYLVARAVAARMMRPDRRDLPTPDQVEAAIHMDMLVARLDDASKADLKHLLHAVEHLFPLATGRVTRFTRLDGAAQDAVLTSMMTSSTLLLRGAFEALKGLAAMAYFRDERTWTPIGYDGPLVGRPASGWASRRR